LVSESTRYFDTVYSRLGVTLTDDDLAGESMYNPMLADVCAVLEARGLARVDDGALCVFPSGFAGREGEPQPLIIRNRVGGYTYATTDLAAVRHRTQGLGASLLVYVVGAPQAQHLAMVFQAAREAGWLVAPARAWHVAFGSVLGADKKMYRTRVGDSIKLVDLLDEAVERALAVVASKSPGLSADEQAAVARAVGIGAVKYADLSNDRVKDYVFDWDRMLAFDGNTAPYLQYAHARIRSIERKAAAEGMAGASAGSVILGEPAERALALQLLGFAGAVAGAVDSFQPHRLCTYLFELGSTFTSFYEQCPVLVAPSPELRASRLALCGMTAQVLGLGLGLLGIEAPDRM
jgi:arginyl-tRNA synthetase